MANFYISVLGENISSSNLDPKWVLFREMALSAGIKFVENETADFYVAVEHSRKHLKANLEIPVKNRLLVVVEPAVVHPRQHLASTRKLYGNVLVLTNGFSVLGHERIWKGGHLPDKEIVLDLIKQNQPISSRAKSAGLINAQKYSYVRGSLYKKRLQVLRHLAKNWDGDVYLAGKNWNTTFHKSIIEQLYALIMAVAGGKGIDLRQYYSHRYAHQTNIKMLGPQDTQYKFLSQIKFAIVVENQANYISEKLLNAFIAGCVPIYLGGNLNEYGIPDNCVIQLPSDFSEVDKIINELSSSEIEKIVRNGEKYITDSEILDRWSVSRGFQHLLNELLHLEKYESST